MNEKELNKKWETHRVVTEAIQNAHLEPSPETRERLAALETNQQNIMEKLQEFQQENKEQHTKLFANLNELNKTLAALPETIMEKADKRYAGKDTEKAMYALIGAICLGVIYILINHLLK